MPPLGPSKHVLSELTWGKVQQRGIDATRSILTKLLEGLDMVPAQPVMVVDLIPNRCP